ncbi:MAG: hypothetical protein O3A85_02495 [Proteobacteria bacterium]|nr:hypothetical protein [Pseudomonadota bacterium]
MTNQNTEAAATSQEAKIWPLAIIAFCLVVLVLGWGINALLVVNDGALRVFIETFLPIFQWLLRLPEHFIV